MSETPGEPSVGNVHALPFGQGVRINEGEVVPVGVSLQTDRMKLSLPLGGFTLREGKTRFVPVVDIEGLVAIVLGIGVGIIAVRTIRAVLLALIARK